MDLWAFLPYGIIIGFAGLVLLISTRKTKEEKEEEAALRARLDDEFYYDGESGQKLSLEELENDEIIIDEVQLNRIKTEEEIKTFFQEEERDKEFLLNSFKRKGFTYLDLTEEEIDLLSKTLLLSQYDNWTYTRPFIHEAKKIRVLFVTVENYYSNGKYGGSHNFNQLFYWVQNKNLSGHIYFRERSSVDKFVGLFEHQDELVINEFLGTAIVPVATQHKTIESLAGLLEFTDIDLEQIRENVFVKTQKLSSLEECEAHFRALEKAQQTTPYSRTQI
ncbi:MAG: hypothetical protein CFE21_04505 [Bacteroidetes bacterium B1(2017)]|nr:MAG: hypothetical protein CFE21_04505 [Bacteroidetes bacterium B1(2017)]